MEERLQSVIDRFKEIEQSLNDPHTVNNPRLLREASREFAALRPVAEAAERYLRLSQQLEDSRVLAHDAAADAELRHMAHEEVRELSSQMDAMGPELERLLVQRDPEDLKPCIVEIRAGTGGDEAALFAADLFRMYTRYCERRGWPIAVVDHTESDLGGFKEITFEVQADEAYGTLKYESGVHRVQRVPETETQGRVHTSAATVAVLPEAEEVDVVINDNDLRIDIFRSGGKGGQNVNKVETAVRIVHLPTNIVVQCQDERSQLKNREKAMKVLRARLYELELEKRHASVAGARKSMVRSGDRSEKIRTYNWPQNRVTDHRLEGEGKNRALESVVNGDLDELLAALRIADSKVGSQ